MCRMELWVIIFLFIYYFCYYICVILYLVYISDFFFLFSFVIHASGLPVWLHNIPGIQLRTANPLYMVI